MHGWPTHCSLLLFLEQEGREGFEAFTGASEKNASGTSWLDVNQVLSLLSETPAQFPSGDRSGLGSHHSLLKGHESSSGHLSPLGSSVMSRGLN